MPEVEFGGRQSILYLTSLLLLPLPLQLRQPRRVLRLRARGSGLCSGLAASALPKKRKASEARLPFPYVYICTFSVSGRHGAWGIFSYDIRSGWGGPQGQENE